jgi:tRNA(Arg) A34 adenosine deaminase TadA
MTSAGEPEQASSAELVHLRATFAAARAHATAGGLPFAARLVDANASMCLEAVNEVMHTGDPTAHAEMMLLRQAATCVAPASLRGMTLYAAAEPCAMCAAAIIWSGVGRVVYGVSASRLRSLDPLPSGLVEPGISGRALFDATSGGPEVVGPTMENEGEAALFPARDLRCGFDPSIRSV